MRATMDVRPGRLSNRSTAEAGPLEVALEEVGVADLVAGVGLPSLTHSLRISDWSSSVVGPVNVSDGHRAPATSGSQRPAWPVQSIMADPRPSTTREQELSRSAAVPAEADRTGHSQVRQGEAGASSRSARRPRRPGGEGLDLATAGIDDLLPRAELDGGQSEFGDPVGQWAVVRRQVAHEPLQGGRARRPAGAPAAPTRRARGEADHERGPVEIVGAHLAAMGRPGEADRLEPRVVRQLIGNPSILIVPGVITSSSGTWARSSAPASTDRVAFPVQRNRM